MKFHFESDLERDRNLQPFHLHLPEIFLHGLHHKAENHQKQQSAEWQDLNTNKEFSFLTPHYNIDYNGWHIDGTIMEWDYSILDRNSYLIASISKELFHMTDTYVIDVREPENALDALMFVLAIDAEKCSRN